MYLGDYIVIEKQLDRFSFLACCVSTGTEFIARVDADKSHLFEDFSWIDRYPSACRFLRPDGRGHTVCTVHETSPDQCKQYRCQVFSVCTPEGEQIGVVSGDRGLHTTDRRLRQDWEEGLERIPWSSPDLEERMADHLTGLGYRILPGRGGRDNPDRSSKV